MFCSALESLHLLYSSLFLIKLKQKTCQIQRLTTFGQQETDLLQWVPCYVNTEWVCVPVLCSWGQTRRARCRQQRSTRERRSSSSTSQFSGKTSEWDFILASCPPLFILQSSLFQIPVLNLYSNPTLQCFDCLCWRFSSSLFCYVSLYCSEIMQKKNRCRPKLSQ